MGYSFSSARDIIGEPGQKSNNNNGGSYKKANFVNFSFSNTNETKITHRIRLVGLPHAFTEFSSYKNDPNDRKSTIKAEFPDAQFSKRFVRIGHEDPYQCPWRKLGFIGTTKYAQNCFIRNEEGVWELAILVKGKSVFKPIAEWEMSRYDEYRDMDEEDREGFSIFAGGTSAPCFRVTARKTGMSGPKSIEYTVSAESKDVVLSDDMMAELVAAASGVTPDDIANMQSEYLDVRADNPNLPPWQNHFALGHQLSKIFKFTPVMTEAPAEYKPQSQMPTEQVSRPVEAQVEKPKVRTPKVEPVVETPSDIDGDDVDWD